MNKTQESDTPHSLQGEDMKREEKEQGMAMTTGINIPGNFKQTFDCNY